MILLFSIFIQSCEKSKKKNQPMKSNPNALYHGGTDGGYYIEVVDKKAKTFHFKIYLDYNEELILDAYFVSEDSLCGDYQNVSNLHEYISTFNNNKIYIKNLKGGDYCKLIIEETIYDKFKK